MHVNRSRTFLMPLMSLCVLAGGTSACASTRQPKEMVSLEGSPAPTMAFENVTIDPVTVYVDHGGSREILGHVGPRRLARLRIPNFRSLRNLTDLRVIVVPLGTARTPDGKPDLSSAVSSDLEPPEHLVSMRWSLTGRTLMSEEIPGSRR
jgi:hypothetical protein